MEKLTCPNSRRHYWCIELMARLWTALAILCLNCPGVIQADPPAKPDLLNLSLDELSAIKIDTVYAASKFTEKVTDAPSSVTIVGHDEIERFGYRTLSDIIASVRSFDVRYDRNYSYTGIRGFNSLGDYGSRVLLLVDGHRMNDPIFDTAAVGTEGLVDVDLIDRVEFIRGPGSAIYGSNAFFGVINVVTRSGASVNWAEASGSGGSFGTYSGRLTLGKKLANGVEYLFSATDYWSDGPTRLFYGEFNSPATNHGIALRQDGDRYWSTLAKISYGDFTLQGGYVTREKDVPTASFGSLFNAPNTTVDSRGYIELRYAHQTVDGWSLAGRAYYDFYDYHELATYDYGDGVHVVNDDSARAHWWGAEVSASRDLFEHFHFVLGADFRQTLDLSQRNYDERPFASYLDVGGYQLVFGAYVDGRWDITKSLSLSAGARWDLYDSFGNTVNPRAALIWKPRDGTTLKLLYGEAFRAPNVYQLYYTSIDQRPNPGLQPETIRTYEAVLDQYLAQHWHGSVSLFRNEISGLIDTTTDSAGFIIFTNASDASVNGAELEIEGKWDNGVLTRASYTRQEAVDAKTGRELVNSPKNVLKSQVSVPVWRDKIFASVELVYASDRLTLLHHRTGEAWLLNTTLYTRKLAPGLEVSASIYNLLDQKYGTPGGPEHVQDSLTQDGRTFRIKFTYRF
jgi:outer membrane receptor for ferrienterochelin and colicins